MTNHFKPILILFTFMTSYQLQAMSVIKLNYTDDFSKRRSNIAKSIIIKKYSIPKILIDNEYVEDCNEVEVEAMIHLCIDHTGEINSIFIDHEFFFKSIKTFSNGENL